MIKENIQRNARKNIDIDPVTGLNCVGKRFELNIEDKGLDSLWLPIEMKDLRTVKSLKKQGSITNVLRAKLKRTPTDIEIDLFWLRFCEERYKYDFEFFAVSSITIRDKVSAQEVAFRLNPAQRMLLEELERQRKMGEQINVQILKARQMGFSTLLQMYMKWIQSVHKRNWNSAVCAHDLTAAINIRSMYDNSVKLMPPIRGIKMSIGNFAGTTNIKVIPERGCRITVGTAVKPETVRSQDLKMVHFSEEAFYPNTESNNPELLEASIISAIPKTECTLIARESTANGVGDYFNKQWIKSKKGESTFVPIFAPWFMIPMYEKHFDGWYYNHQGKRTSGTIEDFVRTMNDYERNLFQNYELCTLENLNWRRMQAATMPNESKMKQEYPSNDIEAFQDSGQPVFRADDIEALRQDCCSPIAIGTMLSECPPEVAIVEPKRRREILQNVSFREDPEALNMFLNGDESQRRKAGLNKLQIWEHPDTTTKIRHRYLVVFDPQKGTSESADYGVIKVIDRYWMVEGGKPTVVALFYGHIDKDITIWIAAQVAKWYNDALLVVESNTYDSDTREDDSEFIFDMIADSYSNLYSRTPTDKIRQGKPIRYGFSTNRNTKPMIIGNYTAILRERAYHERDAETLNEARTYETKKDGSAGAKDGNHDDRLMATMIGLYVCYTMPTPKEIKPTASNSGRFRRTAI